MTPLLRFDRVRLEGPEGGIDAAAIDRAATLLIPGGTVDLFEILQPRLRREQSWGDLVTRIAAAEERLTALAGAADIDATSDVDFASEATLPPPPGAVFVPAGPRDLASWSRIDAMIGSGWPVLLEGTVAPERLLISLFDDPADLALRLAAIRPLLAPAVRPTLLTPTRGRAAPFLRDADAAELLGVERVVQQQFSRLGGSGAPTLRQRLDDGPPPLVVLPVNPSLSLGSTLAAVGLLTASPHAILVLPAPPTSTVAVRWDVSDLVRLDDQLVGAVERPTVLGPPEQPDELRLVPIVDGAEQAAVPVVSGQFALAHHDVGHLGLSTEDGGVHAMAAVLTLDPPVELVFLGSEPPRISRGTTRRVGVRLDATQPLARLRREADQLGLDGLLDAGAILQDGSPSDLPEAAANARARRVVGRLVAAGHRIVGSWIDGALEEPPRGDRLEVLTGAPPSEATRVELLWDNRASRLRRLALFGEAASTIDLQTYQVLDDAVAREVELALARAADRGVRVRVLADAVWSARGTADAVGPTLARLAEAPGLEVRLVRPFSGVPGLEDLKRRDHRKVLLVDGSIAILGGRNIGEPYLRGFDEVPVWRTSRSTDIPWLDLDVELEGDVVDQLATAFDVAWTAADRVGEVGEAPTPKPPPTRIVTATTVAVRLVNHIGLQDARTLDLYREIIDGGRERVTVVNTFPLQFELVTALGRALDRGAAVRILVGNVRPLFGDRETFAGGTVRDLANALIHGRLDELVTAGAAVHEYAMPLQPGWDPGLGRLLPHVHAKCISVDGHRFTVGSANLDITAAYWESEVVLLVEDAAATVALDAQLDALFDGSPQVRPDDPRWQQRAGRRAWLTRNWPATLG